MISKMVMVRCITILLVIILKEIGKMIWKKGKEQWIGQISEKNILASGTKIISMDGEFIYGFSQKAKESIYETDIKEIGLMELEMATVYFIMQTEPNTRDIGKTTWSKGFHFIPMRMEKSLIWCLTKIEC